MRIGRLGALARDESPEWSRVAIAFGVFSVVAARRQIAGLRAGESIVGIGRSCQPDQGSAESQGVFLFVFCCVCGGGLFVAARFWGGECIRCTCSNARRRADVGSPAPQPWYFHRVGLDEHGGTVTLDWNATAWELDDHTFLA